MNSLDFNFDLNLVQSQKLILTPQVKQALEILRMNGQELIEYIEEQLEINPVLEVDDENELTEQEEYALEDEGDDWEEARGSIVGKGTQDEDSFKEISDFTVDKSSVRLSLKEHLRFQLNTSMLSERMRLIGEYIIDNIDENGYLTIGLTEIASFLNIPVRETAKVLGVLQKFDPPGICARSLKECLLIQLDQMDNVDENVYRVVEYYLDNLAENKITAVAKSTGLSVGKVAEIFEFIKTLEPKPGREFYCDDEVKYIVPDCMVKKIKNKFEVLINEEVLPILNISSYYRKVVNEDINIEARKFIQSRIDSGLWLIKCIEQRKNTIRKIAETIVEKQSDFFEKGKNYIKPLTMKEVARIVGMHESTVSRAVNSKYLQCSWGVFELRYFFTAKISTCSGKEISNDNIKEKLKSIIKHEDKKAPFNDSQITELLKQEGIEISRRTIAKYRAEIGIPTVSKRRKY